MAGHVRLALELTLTEAENRVAGGVWLASNENKRFLILCCGGFDRVSLAGVRKANFHAIQDFCNRVLSGAGTVCADPA